MADALIDCINRALSLIAKPRIVALTDTSLEAIEANSHALPLLAEISEWTKWPVLIKRTVLAELTNDRPAEWNYCYALPSDFGEAVAIRKVEDEQWKRTDPEKSARADDMVSKLEAAIADAEAKLEKARAAGDEKRIRELEENLEGRRSFLEMAKRASADYR